ncbi:MAG: hypothetical protein J0M16_00865 [Gammaproteobacteria bacterium]|nr:hypothetical protein [Gammaproteobacteria bacterium]
MTGDRNEFLIHIYDQMFNDINRHIMVVWQSVGVMVSALAFYALVEKEIVSLDVAVALMVLLAAWLVAHLIDAGYWYNRNIAIIANIERQFLEPEDLHKVHYYFGVHRPKNRMISHLKIQVALGIGLVILVIGHHASIRVIPGFGSPFSNFEIQRALPYALFVLAAAYLYHLKNDRDKSYAEFLENSPGLPVDTTGIRYGIGHGFKG